MRLLYEFLDYGFALFHFGFVVFSLFGWLVGRWRRLHLAAMSLVFASWFLLGQWYGIGYCPCTDWHWQVKRKLGEEGLPYSYVHYCLEQLAGVKVEPQLVDGAVFALATAALVASVWVNLHSRRS